MMGGRHFYKAAMMEFIKKEAYESLENDERGQSSDMYYWLDAEKAVMAQIKEQCEVIKS